MNSRVDKSPAVPNEVRTVMWTQVLVTVAIAAGFGAIAGTSAAIAALVGGLINVVAGVYFARRLFRRRFQASAIETVLGFYVGEFVKLLLTVALLALAVGVFKLSFVPLIVACVASLLVYVLALSPVFVRFSGGRA